MATLQELRNERLRKLEALKNLGVNPYPATTSRTHTAEQVTTQFDELQGQTVTLAGRIVGTTKIWQDSIFCAQRCQWDGSAVLSA
jgi:lysyl-tRNA synthetase, class II